MAKHNKVRKRSPLLPLRPFFFRDGATSVLEALNSVEANLFRRMKECDEDEGLAVAGVEVLLMRARRAMREGDIESATRWALELGMEARFVDYTFSYGAPLERGEKFDEATRRGGERKADSYRPRNIEMANEFQKRKQSWGGSSTALMVDIGKARGLRRSASIKAINNGLKIVRSKAKPND